MTEGGWREELRKLFEKGKGSDTTLNDWHECRLIFADWLEDNGGDKDEIIVARAEWKYQRRHIDTYGGDLGDVWRIRCSPQAFLSTVRSLYRVGVVNQSTLLHFPVRGIVRNRLEVIDGNWSEYYSRGGQDADNWLYSYDVGNVAKQIASFCLMDGRLVKS